MAVTLVLTLEKLTSLSAPLPLSLSLSLPLYLSLSFFPFSLLFHLLSSPPRYNSAFRSMDHNSDNSIDVKELQKVRV